MKTVTEVSRLTGASVRTLHHYDAIGLLAPTHVTEAGYRLYDEKAVERLHMILVYRELGFSLERIRQILHAPNFDRNRVLEQQIELLQEKVQKLQNRITFAKGMLLLGVDYMDFGKFDPKKMDDYAQQATVLYGKTDAYKEYEQKAKGRTKQQEQDLGDQVMALFVALGQLRPCDPESEAAQNWAAQLQAFFTEHFYTCTDEILSSFANLYDGGGRFTQNIDKAGGPGTAALAAQAIRHYTRHI